MKKLIIFEENGDIFDNIDFNKWGYDACKAPAFLDAAETIGMLRPDAVLIELESIKMEMCAVISSETNKAGIPVIAVSRDIALDSVVRILETCVNACFTGNLNSRMFFYELDRILAGFRKKSAKMEFSGLEKNNLIL
jgi:DNA-binding response OmpR family regulator